MSDINKTISISYRAEVQNLVNGLKKVGQVSEKEAKKLVNDLDKAYTKAAKEAKKSGEKQERALKKVSAQAKKTGKGIKASFSSVGIAAGLAAVAVFSFGKHIADMSNQLVDASTKTGINTNTLQGLRLAAEGAGVSFEELEMGLVKLPSMMVEAAEGGKTAQKAFEALGVQTTETVDGFEKLRSADDVLKDIFHSLQNIESAEEKAARAADIFGRTAGPKLIQSGAIDNLEKFVSLANEFGVASGPRMQKEMADFQRNSANAMMVLQGELIRTFDVLMGGEGGAGGGLNKAMDLLVESFVVLGSVAQNVLGGLNLHFQKLGFEILPVIKILMGDVGEGVVLMEAFKQPISEIDNLLQGEIGEKFASPIEHAMVRLGEFRKLVESTGGTPTTGGRRGGSGGGAGGATKQVTKAVDELAIAMKMVEEVENKTLAAMVKARDERVEQLSGEEKILAVRDISLQKIHEEKMALEESIESQIKKLKAMEQTADVQETISNLEFVKEDELARLQKEKRTIIQEAHQEQLDFILEEGLAKIDMDGEVLQKELENDNKRKKSAKEVFEEYMEGFSMVTQGLNIAADLIDQNAIKNKKNAELVFNIRKAAAIAEIAISTAKNVVDVFPNPFLMAGATALGIAQGALVAGEQPKFHMGGMIGGGGTLAPDETTVTAKRGEAILSTSAVSRIGEDGVRQLETGGGITPKIIVMNPFKHYDRFIRGRDAMGMGSNGTGRKGY
jgi:hypothetical protein